MLPNFNTQGLGEYLVSEIEKTFNVFEGGIRNQNKETFINLMHQLIDLVQPDVYKFQEFQKKVLQQAVRNFIKEFDDYIH